MVRNLLLLYFPVFGMAQTNYELTPHFDSSPLIKTYVPDDNFENYLEANGMGDGIALNDSVLTLTIEMLMYLDVSSQNISDMTGIEDFTALSILKCYMNNLTELNVSNNLYLTNLSCYGNQLNALDVSSNLSLTHLYCGDNPINGLDVSNNIALEELNCHSNQLSILDVSANTALHTLYFSNNQITNINLSNNLSITDLWCSDNLLVGVDLSDNINLINLNIYNNNLTFLDLRNGSSNMYSFNCTNNPNLTCIDVDDVVFYTSTFTLGSIDSQQYFSNNCSVTAIKEIVGSRKKLIKVIDVLGRKVLDNSNQPLFYIYNNGTVKKSIALD